MSDCEPIVTGRLRVGRRNLQNMTSTTRILATALVAGGVLSPPATASSESPVVVELFTSQSCYSCPPAEAYLGQLAEREDVVALEFHVDYWDDLVYGRAGRWKDVFSAPAHTKRQRTYNARIFGVGRAYTPQMVIDGRYDAVGNRQARVDQAIARAAKTRDQTVTLNVATDAGSKVHINIEGSGAGEVWLVQFEEARTTAVMAGENKGKTLTNHHAVTDMRRVGTWAGGHQSFAVPDPSPGQEMGCAILVQEPAVGEILAGRYCP